MTETRKICTCCGQLLGIASYDEELWDLYSRRRDGRQYGEALVFTSSDFWDEPDDNVEVEVMNLAMERDMVARGLCPECGRPNFSGLKDEDFVSEEEARELADMAAEQAAERRAGC